jgi:hypothetical protein
VPNIKSAKKRHRQSLERRARNRSAKSHLKTAIKKLREAVEAKNFDGAKTQYVDLCNPHQVIIEIAICRIGQQSASMRSGKGWDFRHSIQQFGHEEQNSGTSTSAHPASLPSVLAITMPHPSPPTDGVTPLISVVVMTFNRPDGLRRCLASLAAQTLNPLSFEVVVIDVSNPTMEAVLAPFRHQLRLIHHPAPNQGVAANRNVGARAARSAVLAFLDDDCIASPAWLETLLKAVNRNPNLLDGSEPLPEPRWLRPRLRPAGGRGSRFRGSLATGGRATGDLRGMPGAPCASQLPGRIYAQIL